MMSRFRLDPSAGSDERTGGTGGFTLVAESDQPIYQDIASEEGQSELGFPTAASKALAGSEVFALREAGGDDASCLNLYQAAQPNIFGVPETLVRRGGFSWAGSAADAPDEAANPWLLLDQAAGRRWCPAASAGGPRRSDCHVQLAPGRGGGEYTITDGRGEPLELQVVGLLRNSVLQGVLLISEAAFLRHFPDASGYRFFLIETPSGAVESVQRARVESTLGDFGFDAEPASERLAEFFAVQNTYLSTFQTLGGFGTAARYLWAGRGAIAQCGRALRGAARATAGGRFPPRRWRALVLWEIALLLVGGLAVGTIAASVALLPHLLAGGGSPGDRPARRSSWCWPWAWRPALAVRAALRRRSWPRCAVSKTRDTVSTRLVHLKKKQDMLTLA